MTDAGISICGFMAQTNCQISMTGELPDQEWNRYWVSLRSRRIGAAIALVAFVVAWIAFGPLGLVAGFLLALAAYWRLRAWPCPRCGRPIVGTSFHTFVNRCTSCQLLIFGAASDVKWPAQPDPLALTLAPRLRRFVAGYEIASGLGLLVLTLFLHAAWWWQLMLEGFAALSLGAGIWLWRDDARGYALSRSVQAVQVIRLQSPWLTYVATAGVYVDLWHTSGRIGIGPGFTSAFSLLVASGQPLGGAVNLWAAPLFLILLHARPATAEPSSDRPIETSLTPVT